MSALERTRRGVSAAAPRAGFKLERDGRLLPQLVAYLEAAGASTVTSELAISWARLPADAQPSHWASAAGRSRAGSPPTCRRSTRRPRSRRPACSPSATSARPRTCGPSGTSAGCWRHAGAAPAVAGGELRGAVRSARRDRACASVRRSRSSRDDVDLDAGVITIRAQPPSSTALGWCRCTPRPSEALARYATSATGCARGRDRARSFSPASGPASSAAKSRKTLRKLTTAIGLRTETVHPRRTRSQTQLRCQHADRLAAIRRPTSTSTSRCCPPTSGTSARRDTYWYLSATPELMGLRRRAAASDFGGGHDRARARRCRPTSPTG